MYKRTFLEWLQHKDDKNYMLIGIIKMSPGYDELHLRRSKCNYLLQELQRPEWRLWNRHWRFAPLSKVDSIVEVLSQRKLLFWRRLQRKFRIITQHNCSCITQPGTQHDYQWSWINWITIQSKKTRTQSQPGTERQQSAARNEHGAHPLGCLAVFPSFAERMDSRTLSYATFVARAASVMQ